VNVGGGVISAMEASLSGFDRNNDNEGYIVMDSHVDDVS